MEAGEILAFVEHPNKKKRKSVKDKLSYLFENIENDTYRYQTYGDLPGVLSQIRQKYGNRDIAEYLIFAYRNDIQPFSSWVKNEYDFHRNRLIRDVHKNRRLRPKKLELSNKSVIVRHARILYEGNNLTDCNILMLIGLSKRMFVF